MAGSSGVGTPRIRYVPGLDGLRGLAVAAVLLFHAGHLPGGYLGVDLFFVLSGYLITSLLLAEGSGRGRIDLVRFWGRRARRLLPALALMLVGVAAYAAFVAEPEELHRIRWDGLATMAYVANWRNVFANPDYWALFTAPSPLEHTWSLAIEEQFYVVWPLVVVAVLVVAARRSRRHGGDGSVAPATLVRSIGVVGAAGAVVSLTLQALWQRRSGWDRVYFGTDTRAFALFAGIIVATVATRWSTDPDPARRRALEAVGGVAAVGLVVAWLRLDGQSAVAHHGGLAACSVAAALVIAAVAHPVAGVLARVCAVAPLRWLGLVSYGVYLYHWPLAVWLSTDRVGLSGWPLFGLQTAVTLVVATVSYRFVEQPIRHGRRWPRGRSLIVPASGFAAVALLLVAATTTDALRTTDVSDRALASAAAESTSFTGTTVLVIGNSVGYYLGRQGFAEVTDPDRVRVVVDALPACIYPPSKKLRDPRGKVYDPTGPADCDNGWSRIARAEGADLVIFVRNGVDPEALLIDGTFQTACSAPYRTRYRELLTRNVEDFAKIGATTVLVTSPPSVRNPFHSDEYYAAYLKTARCGNDTLREVAAEHPDDVRLVDLEARMCPDTPICETEWDGVGLRADGTHFKGAGARKVASWILDQVDAPGAPTS